MPIPPTFLIHVNVLVFIATITVSRITFGFSKHYPIWRVESLFRDIHPGSTTNAFQDGIRAVSNQWHMMEQERNKSGLTLILLNTSTIHGTSATIFENAK